MFSGALIGLLGVLALILLYVGLRFLGNKSWIMGWIRGSFGLCFFAGSTVLILAALDLLSYKQLTSDTTIITVSLEEIDKQHYKINLSHVLEGREETFELRGDQWQIDARVMRFQGLFGMMGVKPSYRLDRISGRYFSLEDERRSDRTVYELTKSEYWLDTWAWLNNNSGIVPGIDTKYGSATYLPMADGALFEVALSRNGLVAKPLNKLAEQAINRWQ